MPGRIVSWGAICCALLGALPATAAAEGRAAGDSQTSRRQRDHNKYVAVLGAVAAPGVYPAQGAQPKLWELIQNAGGFASRATGDVRIIRNGRSALNAHAATGLPIRLQPGDVVVAAGAAARPSRPLPKTAGPALDDGTPVEVALVNLIDRPVVLNLRARHANLPALMELLGQHPNVARFVRVIGEGHPTRLRSPSVLVFDRRVVAWNRIPALPGPIEPAPIARRRAGQPGAIRLVQGSGGDASKTPGSSSRVLTLAPPPGPSPTGAGAVGNPSSPPLRVAARQSDAPRLHASSPPPPPREPAAAADNDLIQKADRSESQADDARTSVDLVTLIIAVFAVLGVLSAFGLLISMARRAMRGPHQTGEPPMRRRSTLDQLLYKEFDVVVEPVAIPAGQSFFGRTAGPRRNRLDEEHAAGDFQRPHIDARVRTETGGSRTSAKSEPPASGSRILRTDGPSTRPAAAVPRPAAPSAGARGASVAGSAPSASNSEEEALG